MADRTTARSRTVEYQTAECVHCGDEVFIDNEMSNVDNLPKAINVIIGGGEYLKTNKVKSTFGRQHRTPRVITKWFTDNQKESYFQSQHLCQTCAQSIYGFDS